MLTPPVGVTVVLEVVPELNVVNLYRLVGEAAAVMADRAMLTLTSTVLVLAGEALSVTVQRKIAVLVSPLAKVAAENVVVAAEALSAVMVSPDTFVHA